MHERNKKVVKEQKQYKKEISDVLKIQDSEFQIRDKNYKQFLCSLMASWVINKKRNAIIRFF